MGAGLLVVLALGLASAVFGPRQRYQQAKKARKAFGVDVHAQAVVAQASSPTPHNAHTVVQADVKSEANSRPDVPAKAEVTQSLGADELHNAQKLLLADIEEEASSGVAALAKADVLGGGH